MAGRTPRVALTLPEPPRPEGEAKRSRRRPLEATGGDDARDPARIEALREWRRREAARRSVPAYVVLHDRTLAALAAARPVDARRPLRDPGHRAGEARGLRQGPARPCWRAEGRRDGAARTRSSTRAGRDACARCAAGRRKTAAARRTCRRPTRPFPRRSRRGCASRTAASGKHVTVVDGLPRNGPYLDALVPGPQESLRHRRLGGRRRDRAPGRPARAAAGAAREEGAAGEGMSATRVYLVRHGATELSAEDRFAGETDVPLSDVGREQLRKLGRRLADEPIAAFYASPLGRTMETARILAEPHGKPVTAEGRAARDLARPVGGQDARRRREGSTPRSTPAGRAIPISFAPTDGETGLAVTARALPALLEIVAAHPGEQVAGRLAQGDDPPAHRLAARLRSAPLPRPSRPEPGVAEHPRLQGRRPRAAVALQRHVALLGLALGDSADCPTGRLSRWWERKS